MPVDKDVHDQPTALLGRWHDHADLGARNRLVELLYVQLRSIAAARLSGRASTLLQPTMLVHEAVLRLLPSTASYQDRTHFIAVAAMKMRAVLVDHARVVSAGKRGGGAQHLTLSHADAADGLHGSALDVLSLDGALQALAQVSKRPAQVLEWAYFGGMGREEIAAVLQVSVPTVDRDLRFAKAWLRDHLDTVEACL